MNREQEINKLKDLNFEDFKTLAKDDSLTPYQKIGFPDSYREGTEELIFHDILSKNPQLQIDGQKILDIGPGCSYLIQMFIDFCEQKKHQLVLIDSQEMLDLLPEKFFITKKAGYYPNDFSEFLSTHQNYFDCVISYSVFHYIFAEGNIFQFIDRTMEVVKPKGSFFIGDIPNQNKRKRFFATETGIKFHQNYTKSDTLPPAFDFLIPSDKIDDGIIWAVLARYRNAGYETYVLPQPQILPMANRREDILIIKI